jgi:hypothetical protein
MEKVLANKSSEKPSLRCSETIHDSKAEKRREVDNPPRILPMIKDGILEKCSKVLITIYLI